MNKARLNYLVDFFIFLFFVIVSLTGLLILFFIPRGNKSGYQEFLGVTKSNWAFLHEWAGIIMIILVAVHLILHWKWIVSMTRNIFK